MLILRLCDGWDIIIQHIYSSIGNFNVTGCPMSAGSPASSWRQPLRADFLIGFEPANGSPVHHGWSHNTLPHDYTPG